jgi:hypothetical protein
MGTLIDVAVTNVVDYIGRENEDAWALYQEAFRELNADAIQRHLYYRKEFDDVMADRQVWKYLAYDDAGELLGLAAYTNCLEAAPLISPAYFAKHWPKRYANNEVWYVLFVAVADNAPVDTFPELIRTMHRMSGREAITVLDVCTKMEYERHLPRSVKALLQREDGPVDMSKADSQSYYIYEFTD